MLCDSSYSFTSRSCSLKEEEWGRSNWGLDSEGESLFLRMVKPDCDRGCSFSKALEVVRMARSLWSFWMAMSTFDRATMALLMRTELFKVGRLP